MAVLARVVHVLVFLNLARFPNQTMLSYRAGSLRIPRWSRWSTGFYLLAFGGRHWAGLCRTWMVCSLGAWL